MEEPRKPGRPLPSSDAEDGSGQKPANGIAERLQLLAERFPSRRKLAQASGISPSTLRPYFKDGGVPLDNAVALAKAAGVRLEWLATGEGPMHATDPPTAFATGADVRRELARLLAQQGFADAPPASEHRGGLGMTWQMNLDRLARAYEQARQGIATLPGHCPDARRLMQITLLIYDEMTEVEEVSKGRVSPPSSPD